MRRQARILLTAMMATARRPRPGIPRIARLDTGRTEGVDRQGRALGRSARIHYAGRPARNAPPGRTRPPAGQGLRLAPGESR